MSHPRVKSHHKSRGVELSVADVARNQYLPGDMSLARLEEALSVARPIAARKYTMKRFMYNLRNLRGKAKIVANLSYISSYPDPTDKKKNHEMDIKRIVKIKNEIGMREYLQHFTFLQRDHEIYQFVTQSKDTDAYEALYEAELDFVGQAAGNDARRVASREQWTKVKDLGEKLAPFVEVFGVGFFLLLPKSVNTDTIDGWSAAHGPLLALCVAKSSEVAKIKQLAKICEPYVEIFKEPKQRAEVIVEALDQILMKAEIEIGQGLSAVGDSDGAETEDGNYRPSSSSPVDRGRRSGSRSSIKTSPN